MKSISLKELTEHHDRVRSLVISLVGDADRGEDALQDLWVNVLQKPRPLRLQAPSGWLVASARRLGLNAARGERRREFHERRAARAEALPSSAEIAERTEVSGRVVAALDELAEPHASVLRDHYLGGLAASELSERDSLPIETVRSRIKRARVVLRDRLEAVGLGEDVHWSVAVAPLMVRPRAITASALGTSAVFGTLAMNKLLLLVLAALLLLVTGLCLVNLPSESGEERLYAAGESAALALSPGEKLAPSSSDAQGVGRVAVVDAMEEAKGTSDWCTITGEVLGMDSRPVADVKVWVASWSDWPAAPLALPVGQAGTLGRGVEAVVDVEGRFVLQCPLPLPAGSRLTVQGHRHLALYTEMNFENRELVPGEACDLGTLRLSAAAAILGRVTDSAGDPIEAAWLLIDSADFGAIGENAATGADGRYVLGHNPAGEFTVFVRAKGYLDAWQSCIAAHLHQDTLAVDFQLEEAPTISGQLLDEGGDPIAGQKIWGWPESAGEHSSVKGCFTESDGRFSFSVGAFGEYGLQVSRKGYREPGAGRRGHVMVESGQQDVRIVLERYERRTVRVLDDVSGDSLTDFGIKVLERNGSKAEPRHHTERTRPPVEKHASGEAACHGDTGVDMLFVVAPSYVPFTGDLEPDEEGGLLLTIRLRRRDMLVARVLHSGSPVAGALVRVESGTREAQPRQGGGGTVRVFKPTEHKDETGLTAGDGTFEIPAPGGWMRITATSGTDLVATSGLFRSAAEPIPDLHLDAPGLLEGHVVTPPGVSPEGLKVMVDEWFDAPSGMTGHAGYFRIEALRPGWHTVILRGRDPELESIGEHAFEVHPGTVTRFDIDASGYGRGQVALRVTVDGEVIEGLGVDVDTPDVLTRMGSRTLGGFGKCDATGRVSGHARTHPRLLVGIYHPDFGQVFHPNVSLAPVLGEIVETEVAFEMTNVVLAIPESVEFPIEANVTLSVLDATYRRKMAIRSFSVEGGALVQRKGSHASLDGHRLSVEGLVAGDVILRLELWDRREPLVWDPTTKTSSHGSNSHVWEQSCTLKPGDHGLIALE